MKRFGLLSFCVMALSAVGAGFGQAKPDRVRATKASKTRSRAPNKTDQTAYQQAYHDALETIYGDGVTPKSVAFKEGPFTAKHLKKPEWFQAWKAYVELYIFSVLSGPDGVRAGEALSRLMGNAGSAMAERRTFDMLDQCVAHKKMQADSGKRQDMRSSVDEAQKKRDEMRLKVTLSCAKLKAEINEVKPLLKERAASWAALTQAVRASDAYKDPKAKRFFDQKVKSVERDVLSDAPKSLTFVKKACTLTP